MKAQATNGKQHPAAEAAPGGRRIQVRRSGVHGKGVFALKPLSKGEVVIEYKGEVIDWPEALRRPGAVDRDAQEVADRIGEAEAREDLLRRALEEQVARNNLAEHALPIERLMDRLSAGERLKPEEYALISEEIARIQARNHDHLAKLDELLSSRIAGES